LRCLLLRGGKFELFVFNTWYHCTDRLGRVCLARGRSYTVPLTTLIENCDRWHLSNIADLRDGPMNSMAVLRRDLVKVIMPKKSPMALMVNLGRTI
jgi:hypothetical protein